MSYRDGQGYGFADMVWLYNRYLSVMDSLPKRPMTDSEINKLLDELDKKRGGPPAWRKK